MQTTQTHVSPQWPQDPVLTEIVRHIAAIEPRSKIVLFGSRARGSARVHSDYDLVVIVPEVSKTDAPSAQIRWALRHLDASLDLLVVSPARWAAGIAMHGSVLQEAAKWGIVLYGA